MMTLNERVTQCLLDAQGEDGWLDGYDIFDGQLPKPVPGTRLLIRQEGAPADVWEVTVAYWNDTYVYYMTDNFADPVCSRWMGHEFRILTREEGRNPQ